VLVSLLHSVFDELDVTVVEGGRKENIQLLEQRFDYIFFTGSVHAGRLVMEKAARHLTPVCLELGGKSPVIVDASADINLAAKRIAFGKLINAGQTCVAPDYILVHESIENHLIDALKMEFERIFPNGTGDHLPSIVNQRHFERLMGLLDGQQVVLGGHGDPVSRRISPTLLRDGDPKSAVMQEEIFGPLLPVIGYRTLDEALRFLQEREKPLALYLFATDPVVERRCLAALSFGGGCVNDTIIHLAIPHMGFGGVGESGMGSYHGKASFDTFTHYKGVVKKSNRIDLPFRYHPYDARKEKLVRFFLR
jgi:aldehyde dehydrogenase (NAD+)